MRSGLLQAMAALMVLCAPMQDALAQAHVAESGQYTLRASVVPSSQISPIVARKHGIAIADDRGILNVVVLEGDIRELRSVSAKVSARRTDLAGRPETIDMREVRANDGVSYIGTFTVNMSSTSQFTIEALPLGAEQPVSVEFQERFFTPR